MAKRKRDSSEEEGEMQKGEEWFKKSNKIQRSSEGVGRAKGGGIEEMIGWWREEMGEVMKGLRGMKDWKDELRQMM